MSTPIDLGRPVAGDVVDLILEDHRRFEGLLRTMRGPHADRESARRAFSALHVAHALTEEEHVYPVLRTKRAISEHDAEHGEEEHAEGNEALLGVLEIKGTDTQAYEDAVEKLTAAVSHHLAEEELSILTPARTNVTSRVRDNLGEAFCASRNKLIDDDCGTLEKVRRIVGRAERKGILDTD
ncbi:MAG: hemerythrin domain-containing protein [Nocardioides sp.]|nr:hemerythrin domain-containing protein [Nocardioides sp.]